MACPVHSFSYEPYKGGIMNSVAYYKCKDLRDQNEEFCVMWRCNRFDKEFPCTICPITNDLSEMAKELHLNIQVQDCIAARGIV
jgi:hypothetical protein